MSASNRVVLLDASAVMAFIRQEDGWEAVLETVTDEQVQCLVSAVQLVEVEGKLVSDGSFTAGQVRARIEQLAHLLTVMPFDSAAQYAASFFYARRKPYNLSLGDALCLGLAEALRAEVLTAEQTWKSIPDLPFAVRLIR